jgi:hypothetical protein
MSMPMGSVLNGPNIRDLSIPVLEKLIEAGGSSAGQGGGSGIDASSLVPFEATGEMPEVFPLSEGQKALWFLNRLAPDSSAYNLVFSGKFRPLLDIVAMKKAFALLFERHPLIDTTFVTRGGEPVQIVHKGRTIDFREHDCTALDDVQLKALISEHADRPFNLERGPVVRLELFRTADNAHVALLSMHHIVSDAWSISVMIQDLIEYYFSAKAGRTPKVEPIAATYADFVKWEQAHLASGAGDKMFEFWKEHLAGAPPRSISRPTVPVRRCRPSMVPPSASSSMPASPRKSTDSRRSTASPSSRPCSRPTTFSCTAIAGRRISSSACRSRDEPSRNSATASGISSIPCRSAAPSPRISPSPTTSPRTAAA